jgi:hypothetical protein
MTSVSIVAAAVAVTASSDAAVSPAGGEIGED